MAGVPREDRRRVNDLAEGAGQVAGTMGTYAAAPELMAAYHLGDAGREAYEGNLARAGIEAGLTPLMLGSGGSVH